MTNYYAKYLKYKKKYLQLQGGASADRYGRRDRDRDPFDTRHEYLALGQKHTEETENWRWTGEPDKSDFIPHCPWIVVEVEEQECFWRIDTIYHTEDVGAELAEQMGNREILVGSARHNMIGDRKDLKHVDYSGPKEHKYRSAWFAHPIISEAMGHPKWGARILDGKKLVITELDDPAEMNHKSTLYEQGIAANEYTVLGELPEADCVRAYHNWNVPRNLLDQEETYITWSPGPILIHITITKDRRNKGKAFTPEEKETYEKFNKWRWVKNPAKLADSDPELYNKIVGLIKKVGLEPGRGGWMRWDQE